MKITCPKCNYDNVEGSKFCEKCGEPLKPAIKKSKNAKSESEVLKTLHDEYKKKSESVDDSIRGAKSIIVVAIIICIVGFIAFFLYRIIIGIAVSLVSFFTFLFIYFLVSAVGEYMDYMLLNSYEQSVIMYNKK